MDRSDLVFPGDMTNESRPTPFLPPPDLYEKIVDVVRKVSGAAADEVLRTLRFSVDSGGTLHVMTNPSYRGPAPRNRHERRTRAALERKQARVLRDRLAAGIQAVLAESLP